MWHIYGIKDRVFAFFCVIIFSVFTSCNNNDEYIKKEKEVNFVKYKVYCNNPIAHINIWDGKDTPYKAIGSWEKKNATQSYDTGLTVTCQEDKQATITIWLFVNNKLVREVKGTTPVEVHYKLK